MSAPFACRECAKTEAQVETCRVREYQFQVFGKKCPHEVGFEPTPEPEPKPTVVEHGEGSGILQQLLKVEEKPKWYEQLVEDCKQIIQRENLDIIRRKHELGSRLLREKENITYGQIFTFIKELAKDIGSSWQDLYYCTKFAQEYSNIDAFIKEFSTKVEKLTWFYIHQNLLYEKLETEEKFVECDLCDHKLRSEEIERINLCAKCSSEFQTWLNLKRVKVEGSKGKVLYFRETSGFGPYSSCFCEESVQHPAKANLHMLGFLIETFTEPEDVILDPMAGTGSTGVVANLLGRNAVLVDLEEKFCKWMNQNVKLVEKDAKGKSVVIQGDSRKLSQLLKENMDTIITSPPYSDAISKQGGPTRVKRVGISTITAREYSRDPANIGNLPHGSVNAIITSPPYGEAKEGSGIAKRGYQGSKHSPTDLVGKRSYMPDKFESEQNISRLPMGNVDAVITSPPYAHDSVVHKNRSGETPVAKEKFGYSDFYSSSKENIGNLKEETYLEAMLKVYRECWKVLKEGGKLIVIVKDFIRNKAIVRLDEDTIKLCEAVGFRLVDRFYRKLKQKSFWRILYHQKHPKVPTIEFEHILIFRKD